MKLIYISGPAFFDLDLSFLKSLGGKVECYFFLDLYPKLHKATAVDIKNPIKKAGVFPLEYYNGFNVYKSYLSDCKAYVINRTSDNPLALSNFILQWDMFSLLKKIMPDVVHFNNQIYFNHFYLFFTPLKKIISIHDPFPHSDDEIVFNSLTQKITRRLNYQLLKNYLLFNNKMADKYREVYRLKNAKIFSSKLGIYDYLTSLSCAHINYENDILFFGRIAKYKGLDTLLAAFQKVLEKKPSAKLTIAGSGTPDFNLFGYDFPKGSFTFINRYIEGPELSGLIRGSKIVVCPYKDATQSGVVMSAFAFCKPVVATKVGALPEMIENGVSGLLVNPDNPKQLSDAILFLLNNEDRLAAMENNIKAIYFDGEKSWDRITDNLIDIYNLL